MCLRMSTRTFPAVSTTWPSGIEWTNPGRVWRDEDILSLARWVLMGTIAGEEEAFFHLAIESARHHDAIHASKSARASHRAAFATYRPVHRKRDALLEA